MAIEAAGVELATVLIDEGDITHPDPHQRAQEVAHIATWIDRAAQLGSRSVRIIPGEQDPRDAQVIARSVANLCWLAGYAATSGMDCRCENFKRTGEDTAALRRILDACDGRVSTCIDFGNAEHEPDKYAALERLAPYATAIHAKARYVDGSVDAAELQRCLASSIPADYRGTSV